MTVVLDASALLAYLQDEPGSEAIDQILPESIMSSVNWSEVVQKSIAAGIDTDRMLEEFQALGLNIELFTVEDAELAGKLWKQTYKIGLSLGDRACLSLSMRLKVAVLTSDRVWASLNLPLDVRLIR